MKSHITGKPADFCTHKVQKGNMEFLANIKFMYNGISRNKPCICGSGKKYKHCCAQKENSLPTQADREA